MFSANHHSCANRLAFHTHRKNTFGVFRLCCPRGVPQSSHQYRLIANRAHTRLTIPAASPRRVVGNHEQVILRIIGHLFLNQYSSRSRTNAPAELLLLFANAATQQKRIQRPPKFIFVRMRMWGGDASRTCDCVTGIRCVLCKCCSRTGDRVDGSKIASTKFSPSSSSCAVCASVRQRVGAKTLKHEDFG